MLSLIFQGDIYSTLGGVLWHEERIKYFFKESTVFRLRFGHAGMGLSTEKFFWSVLKPHPASI